MTVFLELLRDSFYSIVFHLAPRLANVVLFILIGRLSGPREAGIFTLAATYLLIFTTVMRGLDDLLVRQVAREPEDSSRYFASFSALRFMLSAAAYLVIVAVVQFGIPYDATTVTAILVLGLSLLPDSLTFVAQSVLLGRRRFRPPAIVLALVSILKLAGGTLAVLAGGDVTDVAWFWVAGSTIGFLLMLLALLRQFELPQISYFGDWRLLRQHKGAILFFIAMTTLNTLESQSDTILLSAFAGETEVGWYGAATTVAYSLLMFSQAYRFAVYPLMTRYALETPGRLSQLYTGSMQTLALLVLPMVGGIVVLAPGIVRLVFGPEFAPTAPVLRILILSLLFVFLNEPNVRVLLVSDRQQRLFIFLFASALANVSLNLLLIPAWGTIGAAAARVASSFVLFTLCYWDAARHVLYQHSWRIVARPALATALMLAMVYLLRDQPLGAVIGAGMVVYGLAALLTGAVSRQQMRTAYEYVAHRRGVMPSG